MTNMGHDISDGYLRNIAIDILRLFAAFLVICIHCPFSNNSCLYNIFTPPLIRTAVPLFFMTTGYFLYAGLKTEYRILKSINNIIRIYVYASLLYLVIAIMECCTNDDFYPLHIGFWKLIAWICNCTSLTISYGFHLWFLMALIEALCCMLLIKRLAITPKVLIPISVLLIVIDSIRRYFIYLEGFNQFIPFTPLLLKALPYLCLGYCMRVLNLEGRVAIWLLSIGILVTIVELMTIGYAAEAAYFSSILLAIGIFIVCIKVKFENPIIKYIARIGEKYGLWIYVLHIEVMNLLNDYLKTENVTPIEVFMCSLFISIIIKNMIAIFSCKFSWKTFYRS